MIVITTVINEREDKRSDVFISRGTFDNATENEIKSADFVEKVIDLAIKKMTKGDSDNDDEAGEGG